MQPGKFLKLNGLLCSLLNGQSHMPFFEKSDLFFICMLHPLSFDIQKQESEIEAAELQAIEVVDMDQKTKMVTELDGHVMRFVGDQNGNHVIHKCIQCIPAAKIIADMIRYCMSFELKIYYFVYMIYYLRVRTLF